MWDEYRCATSTDEVIRLLSEIGGKARLIAGGTDLILEIEHGLHKHISTLIDISRIPDLDQITLSADGTIHLGPMVTHNHCVASKLIRENAFPLARACWEVGAPQIRNMGTVAGNLITASPANDSISALIALNANVVLKSVRGTRTVNLNNFYTGVRRTVLEPDELLLDIWFPGLTENQKGTFLKLALRRAQSISIVNVALLITFDQAIVQSAVITLGAVAPTIIHAKEAEEYLVGKDLTNKEILNQAATLAMQAASPINDIRASAAYRREMIRVLTLRGLEKLGSHKEKEDFPDNPVLLWGKGIHENNKKKFISSNRAEESIQTRINGKDYSFKSTARRTLLDLLRQDAGLIGTKEGCAEGECGACTVFLDGKAVMACLVPAGRAHGADIITIEGVSQSGESGSLHPVQEAFIKEGAVQCGYCTPGFIMSSIKLLEEFSNPTRNQIQQSITGNLCRCTGYYKILKAVESASTMNNKN